MTRIGIGFLIVAFFAIFTYSWGACPEQDLSGDCVVGIEDLVIFADQWLAPGCQGHPKDCADFIGDDGVNVMDFAVLAQNWLVAGTGAVQVTIEPAGAVSAGAQWRVDGGTWRDSGYTETDVPVGTRTIEYNTVSGWNAPANEDVQINEGSTTTTTGTYIQQAGLLQVTIEPIGALTAGAQWRVDGGAWHDSGFTETSIPVGSHIVEYNTVSGWTTPGNQQVQINDSQTTTTAGTYTQQIGSLRVTIEPAGARSADAQWRVDGGAWHNSDFTETGIPVGSHIVEYNTVSGWNAPANEDVQINESATTTITGTYTIQQTGSLQVTIEPAEAISAGAQWRVDGGVWHNSGDTQTDISVGAHTVSYSVVSGWNTPGGEGVQINQSATTTTTGTYTEQTSVLANIVINEIHYNPDLKQELVEFIELYNADSESVDISGWYFTGVTYTFPAGTSIPAGGYLVVTEDPTAAYVDVTVNGKYGTNPAIIYGPYTGRLDNEGERIELKNANGVQIDQVNYQLGFPWPTVGDEVPKGSYGDGHSIQLVNTGLDNDLGGSWRSAYPTPGAANSDVLLSNAPPQIRQVSHSPKQPVSGDIITITAKVTDADGVSNVTLFYQVNNPGNYIPITLPNLSASTPILPNPAYETGWVSFWMYDDGTHGDAVSGDGTYTFQLPEGFQTHRKLVRYRIVAEDAGGRSVTVPYADDPQPNFAYFVYDGVPSWRGDGVTYTSDVLNSLQTYHLITRNTDVEYCFWNEGYPGDQRWDDGQYHFSGTFVYDGEVYDHIYYHIRGKVSTVMWGKNKSRFNFNRGHYFQARDDYGKKYNKKWDNLVLGSGTCPWWQWPHPGSWDQGAGGMLLNEPLAYRLYNLAGVPSPNTNFFHFRVIDGVLETGIDDQYTGDFWGLFFAIENQDGRYLKEHDLPDGNVYKMELGYADQRNQGLTQVADGSDVSAFIGGQNGSSSQTWWENNVDLDGYYSFKTVGIVTNNSDPRPQENCFYFHDPVTDKWSIHPWDLDLTFEWGTHYTTWENIRYCLNYSDLNLAYKNRARELVDLLYDNDHYGWRQTDQLLDEMASVIAYPYSGQRFVDAERAMWNNHPMVSSNYKNLWYEHNEFFTQPGHTKNWDSMVAYYKQFLTPTGMSGFLSGSYGVYDLLGDIADSAIPYTPTISYTGTVGYPENDLTFQTSSFSDPQGGGTFGAIQWRIGRVDDPSAPGYNVRQRHNYEVETKWQSADITDPGQTMIQIPATEVEIGGTYRVRCRMKDNTGRWSHWSDPMQFVTAEGINADILSYLRLTELMYNNGDADFIELKNTSSTVTLDLSDISIVDGVQFSFAGSSVTSLAPGAFVLVVKDLTAFRAQYGTSLDSKIAGTFVDSSLSNSGETIKVEDFWNGTIFKFTYSDGRGWPLAADGSGHSLVPLATAIGGERDGSLEYRGNWRQSMYIGGSPGTEDPTPTAGVVINELMAHTDYSNPSYPDYDSNDWIELYNAGGSSVSLNSNWYLSDDSGNLKKWALPGSTLTSGGRVSYDEITGFHSPITSGFGLDKAGEQIFLSYLPGTSADRVVDCIQFKGQENGISLGRYPNGGAFWFSMTPSRDASNNAPISHVVIREVMYNPTEEPDQNEYIEIYNPTGSSVNMWTSAGSWAIDGGVNYQFPASTSIGAGQRILVVDFDPWADPVRLDEFEAAYGLGNLTPGVNIFGGWSGDGDNLSNSSERVTLEKPQESDDPLDPTDISWIIVDEVIYGDVSPWPTSPDGTGTSLHRQSSGATASGNDPTNWTAQTPTPGS